VKLFRSQEARLEDFQASRTGLDRPFSEARVGPTISEDSRAPLRYSETKNQRVSGRGVLVHFPTVEPSFLQHVKFYCRKT